MAIEFSPDKLNRVNELINRYPHKEAAILPVLYLAQEEFGYLSLESIEYVAKLMGIPTARLYGTVSFYSLLYMKPMANSEWRIANSPGCD